LLLQPQLKQQAAQAKATSMQLRALHNLPPLLHLKTGGTVCQSTATT
jgi:hypothetical protein